MQLVPLQTDQTWPLAVRPHKWLHKKLNQQLQDTDRQMPTIIPTKTATLDDHQDKDVLISDPRKKTAKLETEVENTKQMDKKHAEGICIYDKGGH